MKDFISEMGVAGQKWGWMGRSEGDQVRRWRQLGRVVEGTCEVGVAEQRIGQIEGQVGS